MKYFLFTFVLICAFWNIEVQSNSADDFIKKSISDSRVVIFSKSYCIYSDAARECFDKLHYPYKSYEVDYRNDTAKVMIGLLRRTGKATVPRVFINGTFIGGGEDIEMMYANGSLKRLLDDEE